MGGVEQENQTQLRSFPCPGQSSPPPASGEGMADTPPVLPSPLPLPKAAVFRLHVSGLRFILWPISWWGQREESELTEQNRLGQGRGG